MVVTNFEDSLGMIFYFFWLISQTLPYMQPPLIVLYQITLLNLHVGVNCALLNNFCDMGF